jgi:hypothetical protein
MTSLRRNQTNDALSVDSRKFFFCSLSLPLRLNFEHYVALKNLQTYAMTNLQRNKTNDALTVDTKQTKEEKRTTMVRLLLYNLNKSLQTRILCYSLHFPIKQNVLECD